MEDTNDIGRRMQMCGGGGGYDDDDHCCYGHTWNPSNEYIHYRSMMVMMMSLVMSNRSNQQ